MYLLVMNMSPNMSPFSIAICFQELGINVEHIMLRMQGVALFKKLDEVVGARGSAGSIFDDNSDDDDDDGD